jgi:hypothetical protein
MNDGSHFRIFFGLNYPSLYDAELALIDKRISILEFQEIKDRNKKMKYLISGISVKILGYCYRTGFFIMQIQTVQTQAYSDQKPIQVRQGETTLASFDKISIGRKGARYKQKSGDDIILRLLNFLKFQDRNSLIN